MARCDEHTAALLRGAFGEPANPETIPALRQPPCLGDQLGCPRRVGYPCAITGCASRTTPIAPVTTARSAPEPRDTTPQALPVPGAERAAAAAPTG